ncbi:MAG: BON domain-containing protein [Candidatus Lokiarchaeota archaeon]|nr:BON domain-containing protein [Candidatus Lokiarchaeota archaeon]
MNFEEQVKKDIVDELESDSRVDASNVKVTVNEHKAILEGTVDSYFAKESAEKDTWSISGVFRVENHLKIKYKTPPSLPVDNVIKQNIENSLLWSTEIDPTAIVVQVNNRIVTLSGEVKDYWQRLQAETQSSNMHGVQEVINEISVIPTESIADEVIANDIVNKLRRNLFVDVDDVTVKVEHGEVTLSGRVPSFSARIAAREAAENTSGVRDVESHILVSA